MLWTALLCVGLCLAAIGIFGLVRSGIQFSGDKREHTAEEVFAWLRTSGCWGGRPWIICMLTGYALLLTAVLVLFVLRTSPSASLGSSPSSVSPSPEPEASQTVELPVIDYAEILRHSEEYDGQEVRVAGRISRLGNTNKQSFYFSDRLGFLEYSWFEVRLSQWFPYNESVSDYYSIDQYVLVQGVWKDGRYDCFLSNAEVITTGQEAQAADQLFMDEWMRVGQSYADLPITDYMDLSQFPGRYLGQRVRTVGQVKEVGSNSATYALYFSFRSRKDNSLQHAYTLRGCPPEMKALCVEGEYVVLSCLVAEGKWGVPWFSECFVECVGDEARALAEQSDAAWWERFFADRAAYIADCQQYTYDELARYPNVYTGKQIVLSGIVTQIDGFTTYTVLLDVGEGQIVYIEYSGKLPQDPEILEGDQITFYGECHGRTSYETPLGESKTVPRVTAQYSSFNQFDTP